MKFSIISILLSIFNFTATVKINTHILKDYWSTDGKTQILYGFLELKYSYKYYYLIISFVSLFFLISAFKNKESEKFLYSAMFIFLLGTSSIIIGFWKWFV